MSRYRNRIEIIADILNIVRDGARKTQIMYKGNLSYKLLTRYMGEVIGAGLVCVGEKTSIYRLTEKGENFLRYFESYLASRTAVDQHLNNIKNTKAMLEDMCLFRHAVGHEDSGSEVLKKSGKDNLK
ncbi:MAG: winged helix-turn-helix domain-containing protein [Candidatus Bathyarchaeia archaeon]